MRRIIRKIMKTKLVHWLLAAVLLTGSLTGCGGSGNGSATQSAQGGNDAAQSAQSGNGEAKPEVKSEVKLTIMIDAPADPWNEKVVQMVVDRFPEYQIISKTWNESTVEQTIKTAYAANQAIDVVLYWPTYMKKFEGTGIPMDLTKYLEQDPEWKNSFVEGTL